jgi:putative endonuclease
MRAKDALGAYGERLAVRRLEADGLRILQTNWRCREGEIDIVAADGDVLVVCEVKTRSSREFGDPAEAVVGIKAARLRRLALRWLQENGSGWADIRFDVVTVLRGRSGPAEVEHLAGAF